MIQPVAFELAELAKRLIPSDFLEGIRKKYPDGDQKKIDELDNPYVVAMPMQELERYQKGIIDFIDRVVQKLPQEQQKTLLKELQDIYDINIRLFLDHLSEVLQNNLGIYFEHTLGNKEESLATPLTSKGFDEFLEKNEVVLVDFWAGWCQPCKAMIPILNTLIKEYKGQIAVAQVNIEEEPDLQAQFSIHSLPSLFFFKKKELKNRLIGAQTIEKVREAIDATLIA